MMYYNTHETEILPDAREVFWGGDYERTVELCTWHYIIVGNQDAMPLKERAERCNRLTKEMHALRADGKMKEAKEMASIVLSINPVETHAGGFAPMFNLGLAF